MKLPYPWVAAFLLCPLIARAFPPIPPHEIYGTLRDGLGNPLRSSAIVVLESASGTRIQTPTGQWIEPGVDFRLFVPMDAGLDDEPFVPTALHPESPFRIRVRVGKTTYLPMEMTGDFATLGESGKRTRLDLTLGVDADGNGLPDAWEQAAAKKLGLAWTSGSVRPGDLYGNSGLSFLEVYAAETYAKDPKDGFALRIQPSSDGPPALAFTAIRGRTYTIEGSSTLGSWQPVAFRRLPADASTPTTEAWTSPDTRRVEVEAPVAPENTVVFYRLRVR